MLLHVYLISRGLLSLLGKELQEAPVICAYYLVEGVMGFEEIALASAIAQLNRRLLERDFGYG